MSGLDSIKTDEECESMTVAQSVELLRDLQNNVWTYELECAIKKVCDALEWRPIETAPKGPIDGCGFGPDITLWDSGQEIYGCWRHDEDERFCGWYDHGLGIGCERPTHWRPVTEEPA